MGTLSGLLAGEMSLVLFYIRRAVTLDVTLFRGERSYEVSESYEYDNQKGERGGPRALGRRADPIRQNEIRNQ